MLTRRLSRLTRAAGPAIHCLLTSWAALAMLRRTRRLDPQRARASERNDLPKSKFRQTILFATACPRAPFHPLCVVGFCRRLLACIAVRLDEYFSPYVRRRKIGSICGRLRIISHTHWRPGQSLRAPRRRPMYSNERRRNHPWRLSPRGHARKMDRYEQDVGAVKVDGQLLRWFALRHVSSTGRRYARK